MTRPDDMPDSAPLDAVLRAAVSSLRTPVEPRADAVNAVKLAIRAEAVASTSRAATGPRSRLRWLTTPRAISVSPLTMLAATLALVIGGGAFASRFSSGSVSAPLSTRSVQATTSVDSVSGARVVRFTLVAPNATQVALVGDFNAWDPVATALEQRDGIWTVVIPVTPGRHQYGFVVDGSRWTADAAAAQSADADFGSVNSVVFVES